jgi:hypothetical protein
MVTRTEPRLVGRLGAEKNDAPFERLVPGRAPSDVGPVQVGSAVSRSTMSV